MGYQSKTYSLSDEVIAWLGTLKDDYGSVNKGLLAMMIIYSPTTPQPVRDGLINQGRGNQNPDLAFAVQVVEPQADNRPKNCFCKHCGSRFAGPKFSTICSECKGSGHTLTPAECPRCTEAQAI